MESQLAFVMMILAALVFQALILYLIILWAVRPGYRETQLEHQIRLLRKIVIQNGASVGEVDELLSY
jgi:hypothetical protein